ncbi:Uncharacterized protein DAT39_007004, partial [Clarias magur]
SLLKESASLVDQHSSPSPSPDCRARTRPLSHANHTLCPRVDYPAMAFVGGPKRSPTRLTSATASDTKPSSRMQPHSEHLLLLSAQLFIWCEGISYPSPAPTSGNSGRVQALTGSLIRVVPSLRDSAAHS